MPTYDLGSQEDEELQAGVGRQGNSVSQNNTHSNSEEMVVLAAWRGA